MYAEPFPHPSGATPPVIAAGLLPKHVAIVMDGIRSTRRRRPAR